MEKTTIYLSDDLKMHLLETANELSRKRGKRIAMSDIIREALVEYFEKRGTAIGNRDAIHRRMLLTKGALDEDAEQRIREEGKGWEARSV